MDAAYVCMSEDNLCKFSLSIIWVERFEQVIGLDGSFYLPAEWAIFLVCYLTQMLSQVLLSFVALPEY